MMRNYTATQYNVHIPDSFEVSKNGFDGILDMLAVQYPNCEVWHRSRRSLKAEWACHSFAYYLGLWRSHTKDIDLNYPQPWYVSAAYYIGGALVWPFIK